MNENREGEGDRERETERGREREEGGEREGGKVRDRLGHKNLITGFWSKEIRNTTQGTGFFKNFFSQKAAVTLFNLQCSLTKPRMILPEGDSSICDVVSRIHR